MKRKTIAFVIACFQIVAATVLECLGYPPNDQVLLGFVFGIIALMVKEG